MSAVWQWEVVEAVSTAVSGGFEPVSIIIGHPSLWKLRNNGLILKKLSNSKMLMQYKGG